MDCFCPLLTRLHRADWRVEIKKKKLGDNIKLVENLRVNKRWLGKFNKIHKFRKEKMIPRAITNYRKYKETREIKKKENVYAHEFIYYRSRRINRYPLSIL